MEYSGAVYRAERHPREAESFAVPPEGKPFLGPLFAQDLMKSSFQVQGAVISVTSDLLEISFRNRECSWLLLRQVIDLSHVYAKP